MKLSIIDIAKLKMMHSKDPIHDYDHVARVVSLCNQIGTDMSISESDAKTLEIAAWWHDTARTITSGSSFIFLSLVDDLLSASLLLFHAFRTKNLSKSVWVGPTLSALLFGAGPGYRQRFIFKRPARSPVRHARLKQPSDADHCRPRREALARGLRLRLRVPRRPRAH